jgi:hypothetical protein
MLTDVMGLRVLNQNISKRMGSWENDGKGPHVDLEGGSAWRDVYKYMV